MMPPPTPTPEVLYVFGGFDGGRELNDLWRFDIRTARWFQLSSDASVQVSVHGGELVW